MIKMRNRIVTGINIQYPISRLILNGEKTIETRTYPIPEQYINKEMAIIETPGKDGDFKARIIGTLVFGKSFCYASKGEFYKDDKKHCVTPDSPWKWEDGKPKWGWPILTVKALSKPRPAPEIKGIKFTKNILL